MAEQSMSLWKDREHKETPTDIWFWSLLEKSGFKPERIWKQDPTHLARVGSFVFRLGREHIEAAGPVASGVRFALMQRNAHKLTDLYEDSLSIVFKTPDAIREFRELLDRSDALTETLRRRMARAYARGEHETRRAHPTPSHHGEDLHLAHSGGAA